MIRGIGKQNSEREENKQRCDFRKSPDFPMNIIYIVIILIKFIYIIFCNQHIGFIKINSNYITQCQGKLTEIIPNFGKRVEEKNDAEISLSSKNRSH